MTMTTDAKQFYSTSSPSPKLLTVDFASDPKSGLGAQLLNCDKSDTESESMFCPGYALIGRLLDGETVAKNAGVEVGDVIVAVNGQGFRRFKIDYDVEKAEKLNESTVELDHRTVEPGSAYQALLGKIKAIKATDMPLVLSLERYSWDAQPNAWRRFLAARDNQVPDAMQMMQLHQAWRETRFPIQLTEPGLQTILRQKAVSEIDISDLDSKDFPPTVYVNYGKLLALQTEGSITADDVVKAFVIFTERMLAKASDPRNARTCQFIDLSGVSISSGFRVETLKKIYAEFEPNYPETLFKMVMYPVSSMVVSTTI